MHLAGNEYQTIICGIGGKPFVRERSLEFEIDEGKERSEIVAYLRGIREESELILHKLANDDLQKPVTIHYSQQDWMGMKQRSDVELTQQMRYTHTFPSAQALLLHVAEHYGYHTGQIVLLAKFLQSGSDNITEFKH